MEGYAPHMRCIYIHFDLLYRPEISHWDFSIPGGGLELSEFSALQHPPIPPSPLQDLCGKLQLYNHARIGERMIEVCAEASRAQPYATLRLSGLMLEVLAEILRGSTSPVGPHHSPLLEEAAEYLRRHCTEHPGLAAAARRARLSPSRFRHLFGELYGCSPRDYLRKILIHRAKQMINGSDMNFSEVAAELGFSTVHSFSRAFKAIEGISPRQYRHYGEIRTRVENRQTPYAH
jgi:AraC-like DNA-binding protein